MFRKTLGGSVAATALCLSAFTIHAKSDGGTLAAGLRESGQGPASPALMEDYQASIQEHGYFSPAEGVIVVPAREINHHHENRDEAQINQALIFQKVHRDHPTLELVADAPIILSGGNGPDSVNGMIFVEAD